MSAKSYTRVLIANKNTLLVLWGLLLAVLAALILLRLFTAEAIVDNSVGVWFDMSDPDIESYDKYNTEFGKKEWTIVILKTKSIYDLQFLRQLNEITGKIEKIDHVVKVTSMTNVRDNWLGEEDELDYKTLFTENEAELTKKGYIAAYKQQLASNPIFDKNLININNDQYTVILVQNHNYINDPTRYRINIVDGIENIVSQYDTIEDWGLAGTTVVNAELNKAAQKDVIVFYLLVSTLLTIICWRILRSVKDLCVVLSVVVTSVMSAMALLAVLDMPYNMATVMLPPILIALSVAGVLHIITDFHIAHQDLPTDAAIVETLSSVWVPAMWAMITTVVGLCSFGFSDVFPIFQLGMFGGFGMLMAWLANMIIAPLLMYIFWSKQKKSLAERESFAITKDSKKIISNPWLIGFILVLLMVALYGLKDAEVDTDYSKFFAKSTRITQSYDLLKDAEMGQNPIIVYLKYPSGREFIEREFYGSSIAFENALKAFPEVIKMLSVSDLIREIDKAYNGPETSGSRLTSYSQTQLAQLFLLGELSGNDDINDLALKFRNGQQLVVLTPYMSSKQLRSFRQRVSQIKAKYLPKDVEVIVTGTTVLWANMDTQITKTQTYSLIFIGLFLLISLPLVFRSIWLGGLGVLINFLPLAATIGLMSWFGIKINMATVILGAISIGVVVDDTIHMFYRIQRYRRLGNTMLQAVDNSMTTIGTSIYRTTVILIVAFTCMATSDFLPTAHFGIFVSISVLIALFLDLFVAPAILIYCSPTDDR